VQAEEHEKLRNYTISEFKHLYTVQHDTIKAYLCDNELNDLVDILDLGMTEGILQWWKKEKHTSFDQFLIDNRFNHLYDYYYYERGAKGLHGLLEVKGALLLGQNRLSDAHEIFRQIPENELWKSKTDPFSSRINDCRMCDEELHARTTYNHLTLVRTIMDYEQKIKSDAQHATEYHQLLGNVYYNMSYFGNATEALTFKRNYVRMSYRGDEEHMRKWKTRPDMNCSRAQLHYIEAMKLAESSGNLELAAECCFMAAKCEQNEYYITVPSDDENNTTKNTYYRTYFKQMKERYSKTQFYGKAINECKYFNYFVSR
jgi:hypothetical protein